MMYLHITRRNPASDRNSFHYHYWILGDLSEKQRAQLKRFGHRTRGDVIRAALLAWWMAASLSSFILLILRIDIPVALVTPLAIASVGCSLCLRRTMPLWQRAQSQLRDRQFTVDERSYSWRTYHRIIGKNLRTLSADQIQIVDTYFRESMKLDSFLQHPQLEGSDRTRIQTRIVESAHGAKEKLDFHQQLQEVAGKTAREYADKAAIADKELNQERRFNLHERVNQALNQPRLS